MTDTSVFVSGLEFHRATIGYEAGEPIVVLRREGCQCQRSADGRRPLQTCGAHFGVNVPLHTGTVSCRHCGRVVVQVEGRWVDTEATGDDSIWREVCDSSESFDATHDV